jgi:hypothetical protein
MADNAGVGNATTAVKGANQITVNVITTDPVPYKFAQVFGLSGKKVSASATATWGAPLSMPTIPIAISWCQWSSFTSSGAAYALPPYLTPPKVIPLHETDNSAGDCTGPAGKQLPGGFSWVEPNLPKCLVSADEGEWVDSKPGASVPDGSCETTLQQAVSTGKPIALPVFEETNDKTGAGAEYKVAGFLAVHVTGFKFPSVESSPAPNCNPLGGNDVKSCLIGHITQLVTTGTPGSTSSFGVIAFKLTA